MEGQLAGLRAVGEHRPDVAGARAGGFEYDVPPVGGPGGPFIARGVAG